MPKKERNLYEVQQRNDRFDVAIFPNTSDSGESEDDESSDEIELNESFMTSDFDFPSHSYSTVCNSYNNNQKKLEETHEYTWKNGEHIYSDSVTNEIILSDSDKKIISNSSHVELFGFFFSAELKAYLIEATQENGYELSVNDLDTFLGIIIFSTFNKRLSQRDYWSNDPFLKSDVVCNAMSRNKFELIKKNLKGSKLADKKDSDKVWRVRPIINIFKSNIMRFGIFSTSLSIDEMMVKYYGRFRLKQFIKSKPIRFGIKMWALGSVSGYVFNFDIYCGKNEETVELAKCALGSRVVLSMLQPLLINTPPRKLRKYHVYFDNLFSSPDLLIHLKNAGLRSTGTVRDNRVGVKNDLDKNARRGTHQVKHEQNSGLNFITVQDSKPVSILSTAAGVSPLGSVTRYDKVDKMQKGLSFPHAFTVYNQFMGGIDTHDQHCSRVLPIFRSKKWTWVILMRLIQTAITNATVLWNTVKPEENRGTKDFAIEISKYYLEKNSVVQHKIEKGTKRSYCSMKTCKIRTSKVCRTCEDKYYCEPCFKKAHLQ